MADAGGEGGPLAEGCQDPATLMPMTGDGPQIVIKGRREDWPGGARTLTPREPGREPNRQTFWFGAELDPDGSQVWFRITSEAVRRMREGDAVGRGERLVDALLAWLTPARRLGPEVNWSPMTATPGSSATAATEARPRPVAAGGTRWSSWTPRPQRRGARASRQRPPGGARPPNPRRNHPSPARAGRRRGRSRTTSTRPAPRTSRGRCAACSCTIRGRSRRRASRRPAGSASGSGRRPATGNARQR